ncbi:hypothetical protein [Vagococcus penaei]|uniref:hypothetical protein n=1 Tax=Vagococcus penaei TaxID=633807 RepID=UPI0013734C4A|nr:hypothetical protein [Vagococcus penaei]
MIANLFKTYQFYFAIMSFIVAIVFILQDGTVAKIISVLFFLNFITNAVFAHRKARNME